MTNREPKLFVMDIFESIKQIEDYTVGISREEFSEDIQRQDAVMRRFEIMGEAVKNLPMAMRKKYSQVPWKEIAGMRDIFIHEYFGIKLNKVWKSIKEDLPELKQQISKILEDLGGTKTLPFDTK